MPPPENSDATGAGSKAGSEAEPLTPVPVRPRRSLLKFLLLALGLLVAFYFSSSQPREQHVRLVLGDQAGAVTVVGLQYLASDSDLARATEIRFAPGAAPRIVSHEPTLADGDYTLRIDLDTREGRRSTERRVTLGGGTTQVDLTSLLVASSPAGSAPNEKPRTSP